MQYDPDIRKKLVSGEEVVVFRDRKGEEHTAPPLTWNDDEDLVAEFGDAGDWAAQLARKTSLALFIWYSVRRHGMPYEAYLEARKAGRDGAWGVRLDQVRDWFLSGHGEQASRVAVAILQVSGFDVVDRKEHTADPTTAAAAPSLASTPMPSPLASPAPTSAA